jgi:hypothetical protein
MGLKRHCLFVGGWTLSCAREEEGARCAGRGGSRPRPTALAFFSVCTV